MWLQSILNLFVSQLQYISKINTPNFKRYYALLDVSVLRIASLISSVNSSSFFFFSLSLSLSLSSFLPSPLPPSWGFFFGIPLGILLPSFLLFKGRQSGHRQKKTGSPK